MRKLIVLTLFAALVSCSRAAPLSPDDYDITGKVTKVTDGYTITVSGTKIRLHGIDTPERNQPYGSTATSALKRKVSGSAVGVIVVDRDRYGRTVGVVYVNGTNVNEAMVCEGHAWWYKKYARSASNLKDCQKSAQTADKGLWKQDNPIPPWKWRRR